MKKRLISLLLALCMVISLVPTSVFAVTGMQDPYVELANPFRDVRETDWFYDSVQYARVNGLFGGTSSDTFSPNGTMTRGMFVTVLGRLAGVDPANYRGKSVFRDVPSDAYYAPYVTWAYLHGITDGTGEGVFSPNGLIDRQQLAAFFMRYFRIFEVDCSPYQPTGYDYPLDYEQVADWAKSDVLQMWQTGLLVGDGKSYGPTAKATRVQMATLCTRLDECVKTWYSEPGVESTRVRLDPTTGKPISDAAYPFRHVTFYDGDRKIDTLTTVFGQPLGRLPDVEKSSKPGAVLLGYYYDEEFTEPFYADNYVFVSHSVYAKYQELEFTEELTVRTFTQMDQSPDLSFVIERVTGAVSGEAGLARNAAAVSPQDGSDPVAVEARDNGDGTYTIYAPEGFREGCSYELTLASGWVFSGKEPTIRTASFSIAMEEIENLKMGDEILYIADDDTIDYQVMGDSYPVMTSDVLALLHDNQTDGVAQGSFNYDGTGIEEGDILCLYVGKHPEERQNNRDVLDPAIYVKATGATAGTVYFTVMDKEAQNELYEVPDNFPLNVTELPAGTGGTISLELLDIPMYESMIGVDIGTLATAREKLSVGDFLTIYVSDLDTDLVGDGSDLYFARVESFAGDLITYTQVTKQDILDSMTLYQEIDLTADDLIDQTEQQLLEQAILTQINASGFAEEAAYLLLNLASATEEFRADQGVQSLLLTDENGEPFSGARLEQLGLASVMGLNRVDLDVNVGTGSHFGGVEIKIGVDANFTVEAEDGYVSIRLSAEFVEEATVAPSVKGELVEKEILGIPVPVGVYISTSVDVKNFTAFQFAAEVTTMDSLRNVLSQTSVASDLQDCIDVAEETGLSEEYYASVEALMQKYNEMLTKETDWIQLVEEKIFSAEAFVYGLVIGVEADFVVHTDMSIAIGSNLSYEVGKRYSFWFKIGLFEPTAGSETMDLIDEQFNFRFYVLGKLGVKAGIKAKIYVGIGSGDLANVGIAAELGPYVKLWGLFIYDYSRIRPAGSDRWTTSSSMVGGMDLEFGLYLTLSFEAEALGLFEYSYDFLDEEYPLLEAGDEKFCYNMTYTAEEDEKVFIWDEDRDHSNGITMDLPVGVRSVDSVVLKTGLLSTSVLGYENFAITLSNPNFSFDSSTGKITVNVPEGTRYMTCDVTVTYLHGKAPFSNYDITTTIPMAWTELSISELKEYHTVTVRAGNVETGYHNVWSTRVLSGQAFDLPTDAEMQKLLGWSDLKYAGASGFTTAQTTGLTVSTDTVYTYEVIDREYQITVDGIQNADGSLAAPRTYKAYYGQTFDFSNLEATCTDDHVNHIYTRFTEVTTEEKLDTAVTVDANGSFAGMGEQNIDLTQPITGAMADALKNGDVRATANYIDDSTTAVFSFNGLTTANVEDVVVTLRKGTVPDVSRVEYILETEVLNEDGRPLGIQEFYPVLGPIDRCTNYIVTCVGLDGGRANVSFDAQGGLPVAPVDKLVGALIVNIPETTRRGYTFRGWYTEPNGEGELAFTQTVPAEGITLYALWTPNPYLVTFDLRGADGNVPETMVVTYDALYGSGNHYIADPTAEFGIVKGDAYGSLPVPTYTGYRFLGWSTQPDRMSTAADNRLVDPSRGALRVQEHTVADLYAEHHTLYAQWTPLVAVPKSLFTFTDTTKTYNGSDQTVTCIVNPDTTYSHVEYDYAEDRAYASVLGSDFTVEYKRQGVLSEWEFAARNAGIYDIRITRAADGVLQEFTHIYYGVMTVNKAESHMYETPTASCIADEYYGNLIMDPDWITNYVGDGAVEFAATTSESEPSSSAWTSGVIFNSGRGSSFYLWVRLSEGNNYHASNAVRSESKISLSESSPSALLTSQYGSTTYTYKLEVTTGSSDGAGTDATVYATVGNGSRTKLEGSGNDHEEGDSREYKVPIGDVYGSKSTIPVEIYVDENLTIKPAWQLASLRLHVYKGDTKVYSGPVCTVNEWFLDNNRNNNQTTATYEVSLPWSLTYDVSGPNGTTVDVRTDDDPVLTMSDTVTDSNRNLTFNASKHQYTPAFTASFGDLDKSFNSCLSWSHDDSAGEWVCTVDCDAIYDLMEESENYYITLTYGAGSNLRTVYFKGADTQ